MIRNSRTDTFASAVRLGLTSMVLVATAIGCGSNSRDDFKTTSSSATVAPPTKAPDTASNTPPIRPLPPMMVGQTYALTIVATENSPSATFTGVLKSSTDESIVLASPVKQFATENRQSGSPEEIMDELINEDVTLNSAQVARVSMVFTPMTKMTN